ncbi:SecDF P1 head subdomain-containing protein [Kribbella sp. CA-247076]|uniref:SecDF P1 head subdomain-containing protein n=1 Tax=Kribbella sp. CA-247076 TaxID=3239941 RepID=UPI003D93B8CD
MAQQSPPPYYGMQPAPPKRNRGPLILAGVLVLVLIAVLTVGGVLLYQRQDQPASTPPATKPSTPDAVEFRRVLKTEPGQCPSPASDTVVCDAAGIRYTVGKVELDGTHVTEVKAAQNEGDPTWHVMLNLDSEGAETFGRLTRELSTQNPPLNQLAIVVRGQVAAAPTVQSAIPGGQVQISSNYTKKTAEDLAHQITG